MMPSVCDFRNGGHRTCVSYCVNHESSILNNIK